MTLTDKTQIFKKWRYVFFIGQRQFGQNLKTCAGERSKSMSMSVLSTDLWYYGDSRAEIMEAQLPDVHPIDKDLALCCLNDPEQSQSQGRLPCASAPHYSYLNIKDNSGYRMQ